MKKIKIYDLYEGKETVGYCDTLKEAKKIARQWEEDTDGECIIVYAKLNNETEKYRFSEYKELKY